jgi:hypothetical protein
MGKVIDITGQKFGKLLVIKLIGLNKYGSSEWECLCDCGKLTKVSIQSLRTGNTKSCGSNSCKEKKIKHGLAGTGAYESYRSAKRRCNNPNCEEYPYYGGRGIKFLWESPIDFVKDMGHRPEGMSIDRIDVNGDYCKDNCRWANKDTQHFNTTHTVNYTWNGVTKPLAKWSKDLGLPESTVYRRYKVLGITDPDILFKPASASMTRSQDHRLSKGPENSDNHRKTVTFNLNGKVDTISGWCKTLGLCKTTIYSRYNVNGERDPAILFRPTERMLKKRQDGVTM